jgi:hypothetical protein
MKLNINFICDVCRKDKKLNACCINKAVAHNKMILIKPKVEKKGE